MQQGEIDKTYFRKLKHGVLSPVEVCYFIKKWRGVLWKQALCSLLFLSFLKSMNQSTLRWRCAADGRLPWISWAVWTVEWMIQELAEILVATKSCWHWQMNDRDERDETTLLHCSYCCKRACCSDKALLVRVGRWDDYIDHRRWVGFLEPMFWSIFDILFCQINSMPPQIFHSINN